MSEADAAARIDTIERGYEYLLAYAAQGRQEDRGTEVRATLTAMHVALTGLVPQLQAQFADADPDAGVGDYLAAVERDVSVARGAIGLVTTHDLALTRIVETLNGRAANVHFEDHLEMGRMVFDYRMRPGVVQRSNALELMRSVGLEV